MSNQFYEFISSELLGYLDYNNIAPGDRYFLILNDYNEINNVKNAVENLTAYSKQMFEVPEYNFSTINFNLNHSDVIFVFISDEITHDFLVTLRNQVSNQEDIWKNKSIVFVINEDLDSITGGSYDLSKEGAPFHQTTLKNKIDRLIQDDSSKKSLGLVEREVLSFILANRFDDEFIRYTLMDFEGIYSIYQQQNITDEDYRNLELFKDKSLKSFSTSSEIKNRLKDNSDFFNQVQLCHSQGNLEQLENVFESPTVLKDLKSDNWQDTEFNSILNSYEKMKLQKKVNVSFEKDEFIRQFKDSPYELLEKPDGHTKAGLRKRNIIIYRADQSIKQIILPFDTKVNNVKSSTGHSGIDGLTQRLKTQTKGKKIIIEIPDIQEDMFYINVTYHHSSNNSYLAFVFKILIVNFDFEFLNNHKTRFMLSYDDKEKIPVIKIKDFDSLITFGPGTSEEITADNIGEKYELINGSLTLNVKNLIDEDTSMIYFYLRVQLSNLKFELDTPKNLPVPRSSQYLYRKIYENAKSMSWDGKILTQDTDEYYVNDYFKEYLSIEKYMVDNTLLSSSYKDERLSSIQLTLHQDIWDSYQDFFDLLAKHNTLPSLAAFNDDLYTAAEKICNLIDSKINEIQDNSILDKATKNIAEIGKLYFEDEIIFTILNPFILRYEIEKYRFLESQKTSEKIIKKFSPSSLIPFYIQDENNYFSEYDSNFSKSLIFKNYDKYNNVQGENIESIIHSRLTDFQKHFSYLFISNRKLPIKLRFKHITEYKHILKGVIQYILNQAQQTKNNLENITPIHLYLDYSIDLESYINIFSINSLKDLLETLDLKIASKLSSKYDDSDILKVINSKINIFMNAEQEYYHITFFNFNQPPNFAVYRFDSLNCSFANNGMISSNSIHTKMNDNYVTGFGVNGIENSDSKIIESAKLWNSLFITNKDKGLHAFNTDSTLVNNISDIASQDFDSLFHSSYWVTFIDPAVDLSYFNDSDNPLYIIHYSDQTSSLNYESVTVTNKLKAYEDVLSEYLDKVHPEYKPDNIDNIIRSFNILNGEWLLNIIGNKKSYDNSVREKLSVIAAYKNVMSLLDSSKIIWIPISLEEILRVSRLQGIKETSDLFSSKELGYKGVTSDDLLFIGLEDTENHTLVHLLPTEVKIGLNSTQVENKAQEQLSTTFKIIKEQLIDSSPNKATQSFYRFFFLNLYFSNLEKFIDNGLVNESKYLNILERKPEILNSENIFTTSMNDFYYSGISVLFTTNNYIRKIEKNSKNPILELKLNEHDAYKDAEKDYSQVLYEWKNDLRGLDQSYFLKNQLDNHTNEFDGSINPTLPIDEPTTDESDIPNTPSIDEPTTDESDIPNTPSIDEPATDESDIPNTPSIDEPATDESDIPNTSSIDEPATDESDIPNTSSIDENDNAVNDGLNSVSSDVRLLLGKVKGSNTDFFWEYGHKNLINRHLLITGKSGQGKTYFMQTLLYEMSKNNLDSFVIDYTDSFLGSQLENTLLEKLEDKINNRFIRQHKLPVNPFKKNTIELDKDFYLPETNQDVAERVVQILDFVFKLGVQQNYKLKEVLLDSLAIYGEDLTFTIVKNRLLENEEHTLLGRLTSLLDRDPFDYNNSDSDWSTYFSGTGQISIFQLKGYPNDIQQAITEFLLWDLYNYSTRSGNKNIALPVLLDEMQNLNHKNNSPTGKIMREGRKFGWSTWLATQSLSSLQSGGHDLSHLYNAGTQIHFAAPEVQIKTISNLLSNDKEERNKWESKLSSLQKGECIVHGYSDINNELVRTTEVVKITSLEDRI